MVVMAESERKENAIMVVTVGGRGQRRCGKWRWSNTVLVPPKHAEDTANVMADAGTGAKVSSVVACSARRSQPRLPLQSCCPPP